VRIGAPGFELQKKARSGRGRARIRVLERDSADNERMSGWVAPPGWRKLREQVFRRDGRVCYRCGAYATTVDHAVPVVLGGSHSLQNLRPACARCNYSAGASLGNRLTPRGPLWRRKASQAVPWRSARRW
jgi:5-methylcytosine-specific restriction endonuclease McrA